MIDKKKISKRLAKQTKIKQLPLLNLYILVMIVLVCIGSAFRIYFLQMLKPIPMIMMIYYLHSKNSSRQYLVPNLIEAGLVMSLIGDLLLMSNEIQSFIIGTVFFLIAHMFYVISFNMNQDQVRFIPKKYVWGRNIAYLVVFFLCVNNVYTLYQKMPNKILFPIYGVALALMVSSSLRRYQYTTPYSFGFILGGSLLFALSDNLLAFLKFNQIKTDFGRMIIMLTYYAGQYLIMHGSLHHSNLQFQIDKFTKQKRKDY